MKKSTDMVILQLVHHKWQEAIYTGINVCKTQKFYKILNNRYMIQLMIRMFSRVGLLQFSMFLAKYSKFKILTCF